MLCVATAPPASPAPHLKPRAASRGDAARTRAVPVSRRAWSTSLALASVGLPTHEALAAASSTDTAPGLARVVLKTASILPETAAEYLVSALGLRLLTEDEDEAVDECRGIHRGMPGRSLCRDILGLDVGAKRDPCQSALPPSELDDVLDQCAVG